MPKLYALKDVKIGFMNPWPCQNDPVAIREFTRGANDTQPNSINTDIEDKELWGLGEYNDETGVITPNVRFICRATEVKQCQQA